MGVWAGSLVRYVVMDKNVLSLPLELSVQAHNGGQFVSRGAGIHPRRRLSSSELIFVRKGVLSIREEDTEFFVEPGQSLLLFAGRQHEGTAPLPPDLNFYWMHFSYDGAAAETGPTVPQHVAVERPDHLTELFRRFLDDQESGALTPLSGSLLLSLMLCELARSRAPHVGGESASTHLAGRADAYIRTHFHQLTAGTLADALGFNANYLSRVYREVYGRSPTEAIQQCRLRHARQLLLEADGNVDGVARACGFDDTGYFRRLFKRHEGMTPRAFRLLYSRAHTNTH